MLLDVFNDQKALSELFRVLKPGGFAFIKVPINYNLKETVELLNENEKLKHNKDFHVRDYAPDFNVFLKRIGFQVQPISYKKELGPRRINFFGLMNCDAFITLSSKPVMQNKSNNSIFKMTN